MILSQEISLMDFFVFFQIPVVASTGGLVDTVEEGVTGFHVGAFNVDVG